MNAATDIARAIEQRLREVDAQLRGFDELVAERHRLNLALDELRADRATTRGAARAGARRARHGSNLQAIIAYVTGAPGSSAADIARATGIDRSVVYSATSRLTSTGRLRRVSKGKRKVGYELAGPAPGP
jgi:hypothetical protein